MTWYSRRQKNHVDQDVIIKTLVHRQFAAIALERGGIYLEPDGELLVRAGASWDGASGPTWDTADMYFASLAHDALYLLIKRGQLPMRCRKAADETLRALYLEAGMHPWRANLHYWAVRVFGGVWLSLF